MLIIENVALLQSLLFPNKHQILSAGHLFVQASPLRTLPGCRAYGHSILFNIFSGRKLLSWGAARKTASEKIWAKCEERKYFSPISSLAAFRAMPQLAERLEEANLIIPSYPGFNYFPTQVIFRSWIPSYRIFLLCFTLKTFKYCVPTLLYFQTEISNFLPEKILNSN